MKGKVVKLAPCLKCGSTDIVLSDNNYSAFNSGGGKCRKCGHEEYRAVSCLPTQEELAAIWNNRNDIPTLIAMEETIIEKSQRRIQTLKEKQIELG